MKKVNSYGLKQRIIKSVKNKNAIMALVIIMVCVFFAIIFQFYNFLVNQIFEERKTHRTDNNSTKKSSGSCVGSYSVSGYTRSDGTKVGDYTRTCGAKH